MVDFSFKNIAHNTGGKAILSAFFSSIPIGLLAVLLKHLQKQQLWGHDWGMAMISIKAPAYASFVGILGFLIIFRTSAAYGRYTLGAHAVDHMRQAFFEVALNTTSFLSTSKAGPEVTNKLRKDIIRLLSLLNALCYLELTKEKRDAGVSQAQFEKFEVFDVNGIDADSIEELKKNQSHHLEVVYSWIHSILVDNIGQSKPLDIAPPIAGRTLAKLAEGMSKFEDCRQTAFVAFPFPYAKATKWLLLVHMIVCPLYMCHLTTSDSLAPVGLFTFLQVFLLWSMQKVAQQLENPFGEDDSDIQLVSKQAVFNEKLLVLWEPIRAGHKPSFGGSSTTSAQANGSYSALAIQGAMPKQRLSKFYDDNGMEPSTKGQQIYDDDDDYEELVE